MIPLVDPGLDPSCLWIIGGLSTAVLGLAGYVVKLHMKINEVQDDRVKWMQDQLALMRTLRDEFEKPPEGGGRKGGGR